MSNLTLAFHEPLFASPLFGFVVPDKDALNADLVTAVADLRQRDAGLHVSNHLGWHSHADLGRWQQSAFHTLRSHIMGAIFHATKCLFPAFDLDRHDIELAGWANVNGKGGFNEPHEHAGYDLSGCYYVSVPESHADKSGVLEFIDPRGITETQLFRTKTQFYPKSGMMVIFPSYLFHWVYPNQDDDERVSIAFNAKIVKKGGT